VSGPTVHVVVPQGVGDQLRPSGGNTYDRRLCDALRCAGWPVHVTEVAGARRSAERSGRDALRDALRALPDFSLVVVDGLVASTVPEVMVPACRRLRVVVLMHLPVGVDADHVGVLVAEREVLSAASAVVATSRWCRSWLLASYGVDPARVHVAHPGVDPAPAAIRTGPGGAFLCVAAVTPGKGHDVLLGALARVADLPWRCRCVGALSVAPEFAAQLRRSALRSGLGERFELAGPRAGSGLEAAYAQSDVLVLPSRRETFGMVITEALARGLPVIASNVGGVVEALGAAPDGTRPGVLTPPDDVPELAAALRVWLTDADRREALRAAARSRRTGLTGWSHTADLVGRVLQEVAA
jgi:glycosyltransferase involved in cell wall biosynthesis